MDGYTSLTKEEKYARMVMFAVLSKLCTLDKQPRPNSVERFAANMQSALDMLKFSNETAAQKHAAISLAAQSMLFVIDFLLRKNEIKNIKSD